MDVTVTVVDLNELPEFPSTETGDRSIAENTPAGRNIGEPVAATDPDGDTALRYYLGDSEDDSAFDIVRGSVQLRTKAPLNREAVLFYYVTVGVSDGKAEDGSPDNWSVDTTITVGITVNDVDEYPVFTHGPTTVEFAENDTADVAYYTADDPEYATITWDLGGDDKSLFEIDEFGNLTFKSPPNFEARASHDNDTDNDYQLSVVASDLATEGGKTATRNVTVTVTDVNDPPTFPNTENGARSVEEGTGTGENIGSPVAATDQDGDTLTYSVTGADAAAFTFNTSTGQLQTKDALDADTKDSYSFAVGVSDSNAADGTVDTVVDATITVTITVSGVDEAPDISGDATPSHAENDTSAVGTYADNDPENDSIDWTLSGDDRGDFLISETGELTFKNTPDSETPVD